MASFFSIAPLLLAFNGDPPAPATSVDAATPPPPLTLSLGVAPSLLLVPGRGGLESKDFAADFEWFVGGAILRTPSVAVGYAGTLGVRSFDEPDRVNVFVSRHMLSFTGIDKHASAFFWRVSAGAHVYSLDVVSGGPSISAHIGWALGGPSRTHRVSVSLVPSIDIAIHQIYTPMLGISIGWLWI